MPTVLIATSKFRLLAEQVAASLDAPDLRMLVVDHPLGGTPESTVVAWADGAVDDAIRLLLGTAEAPAPGEAGASAATEPAGGEGTLGAVEAAVAEIRALVEADGGDVELVTADRSTVRLRLILETAACRECVMPRAHLEQVALDRMRAHLPMLVAVEIDDPRE